MSNFYSLDNQDSGIKRDPAIGGLYNLDTRTVLYNNKANLLQYIVAKNEEMRIDLICRSIYGTYDYIEELLVLNNIKNPFSIVEGQTINYVVVEDLNLLYGAEPVKKEEYNKLVNSNKNTKTDPNRKKNQGLPPTIKPQGMEQMQVDEVNKIIKIISSLE